MEVVTISGDFNLSRPSALVLGNFDGVHVGHQKLIREAILWAEQHGAYSAVLTFKPHPLQVLKPNDAPNLLSDWQQKYHYVAELGPDLLLEIPFTKEFALIKPEDFVAKILVERLNAKAIFVGYNYTFGNGGQGNPALLEHLGEKYGYFLKIISPVKINGEVVSSSLIRACLRDGDIRSANEYLGHNYTLHGTVIRGHQRGRELGFPTANIDLHDMNVILSTGVYSVLVHGDGFSQAGVMNVGYCPTFTNQDMAFEVHIIDFDKDIYGSELHVEVLHRLRNEKAFAGINELVGQIKEDVESTKKLLKV